MTEEISALDILLKARPTVAPKVPEELVRQVFEIEERVQFDTDRPQAVRRIQQAVSAAMAQEKIKAAGGGDAHQGS
ncbi:MAG TPA: hypothetical protein VFC93_17255 [Chloroflexota bacterium]|nr:hypothetical protein [Chloroflexota bacterium]